MCLDDQCKPLAFAEDLQKSHTQHQHDALTDNRVYVIEKICTTNALMCNDYGLHLRQHTKPISYLWNAWRLRFSRCLDSKRTRDTRR